MSSPVVAAGIEVDQDTVRFGFENTYARLPERFYARLNPTPVSAPQLIKLNVELARTLGLDPAKLASERGVAILAGNTIAEGAEPLAIAYAGHQFGNYVPLLGDGRANLLGEVLGGDGVRYDVQLKGSGPTPFSRRGDGRAALGPVLREYLLSEAMASIGIPTTRALAAVISGDNVYRETAQPGAVLTRVAASHLRVGTFQYFSARGDVEGLRTLADYAIARHYPDAANAPRPYWTLLEGVIGRQARLVAQWMSLGFIHGVMNTDNMAISGETIDYGPCAFMEAFHPHTVFSYIDQQGRYAYGNQPRAALWNLARFAESLLPLLVQEFGGEDAAIAEAEKVLGAFETQFEAARLTAFRRKLGLFTERETDAELVENLLNAMAAQRADFTLTFRRLSDAPVNPDAEDTVRELFADASSYDKWAASFRERLKQENTPSEQRAAEMKQTNPMYIPRNHLVEEVIRAAVDRKDFAPFEHLLDVVVHPYDERSGLEHYSRPARPEELVTQTFCGT